MYQHLTEETQLSVVIQKGDKTLIFMEIKIKMKYYCTNSNGKNFNVSPCIAITLWEYGAIRTLTNFWWESNLDRTIFKRLTNLHEVKDMHFTTQQIFPEELRSLLHLSTEDCTLFFFIAALFLIAQIKTI